MITVHIIEWMKDLNEEGFKTPLREIDWRHFKPHVEQQLIACSQGQTIAHKNHFVLLMRQDDYTMKVIENSEGQSGQVFKCNAHSLFMMVRLGPSACAQAGFEIIDERVTGKDGKLNHPG